MKGEPMQLLESGEMYLETIYRLSQTQNAVRSLDVALALGFSKPSVSRAVGILKSGGFLVMDVDNYLSLTELELRSPKRSMSVTCCSRLAFWNSAWMRKPPQRTLARSSM